MSNTNGTYIEDEQKKTTPASAAPAAQAAPTVTASEGYGKFLETLANNKKIENTPTNAKTYADYLTYTGLDPVGDYNAKVRQANLDYAKAMSTYGQNAEKLAKSGLTGSGYGDYLTGLAYTGKQSAVSGAQKEAKAAINQSFASYGDYIEGLKNTNEQTAMSGIINQMLEGDAAREYARSQGVTEDRLEFVLSQTSASVGAARAQKLAEASSAISSLIDNGHTIDSAIAALDGMYDQGTLDKVKENLQNAEKVQIDAVKAKNYEGVKKAINGDFSGISAYAQAAGIDISDGSVDKINDVVDSMVTSGQITVEQQRQYYYSTWMNELGDGDYNGKAAVNAAEKMYNLFASGKLDQTQYKDLLEKSGKRVGALYGSVEASSKSYNNGNILTINYKQKAYGNEAIQINLGLTKEVEGDGFVAGKSISLKGKQGNSDTTLVIGTINGRVAYMKNGKYYQAKSGTPEYNNSKHNAAFISYMMVP